MRGINLDGSGKFEAIETLALAYTEALRGANALQFAQTSLVERRALALEIQHALVEKPKFVWREEQ